MKSNFPILLAAIVCGSTALSATSGCTDKNVVTAAVLPPSQPDATPAATTPAPEAVVTTWDDIKDCSYDERSRFFAGLKQLEAKVGAQVAELTAQRAAMKSTTDTREWDFAMKQMTDARSYLLGMDDELTKASPETWSQRKDKVGTAWVQTQDAYGRVKSSTTG